jgi:GNAT superfamily N-acetyltransferase
MPGRLPRSTAAKAEKKDLRGPAGYSIRPLAFDDLDQALRLSTIAGWNQQLEDWRLLLRIAPAGAFAAVAGPRVVGTAIGIDYGGFAWIAMMLVDPAYRGRGVGKRLLEAAMGAVPPDLPVRLDATSLGQPMYEKYGFENEATLSRHLAARSGGATSVPEIRDRSSDVCPLASSDLEMVIERDREIFGGTRRAVLEWAFHSAPEYAYSVRTTDGVINYCLGRRGRLFDQIGPVVAGREDVAQALVDRALAAVGDRPVIIDAFDLRRAFAAWLGSRGFVMQRQFIRMCQAESGPRAIGAGNGPSGQFAIVGPEFA